MLKIISLLLFLGIAGIAFGQDSYLFPAATRIYNANSSNLKGDELCFELFKKCTQTATPILNYDFSEEFFPVLIVSNDHVNRKYGKNKKHKTIIRKVTTPLVRFVKFNKKIIWTSLGIKDRRKEEKIPPLFYYGQWITEGFTSHLNDQKTKFGQLQLLSSLPMCSTNESQSPLKNVHLGGVIMNFDINQDNNKLLKHFYQNLNMKTTVGRFFNDGFTFTIRLR